MSSNRQRSIGDPASTPDLLIAGASARAATQSAVRCGLRVAAADSFADTDLREIANAKRLLGWPNGILEWTRTFPRNIPFVYTGGVENTPEMLDRIAPDRPIAGNMGKRLHELRDPAFLGSWCAEHGFRTPRRVSRDAAVPGKTLVKPLRSVAGLGIRIFDGTPIKPDEYLQEFVAGASVSAAYLITHRGAELLGTFEQIPPEPRDVPVSQPFLYRGSITRAFAFPEPLERLGQHLHATGTRGLCGVDFIETADGELVILEINPRFTASMELCERQSARSLIGEHLACFGIELPHSAKRPRSQVCLADNLGKRIVYAQHRIIWRPPPPEILPPLPKSMSSLADIPFTGTQIEPGDPVCTLFAIADTFDECRDELLAREQRLLAFLETSHPRG